MKYSKFIFLILFGILCFDSIHSQYNPFSNQYRPQRTPFGLSRTRPTSSGRNRPGSIRPPPWSSGSRSRRRRRRRRRPPIDFPDPDIDEISPPDSNGNNQGGSSNPPSSAPMQPSPSGPPSRPQAMAAQSSYANDSSSYSTRSSQSSRPKRKFSLPSSLKESIKQAAAKEGGSNSDSGEAGFQANSVQRMSHSMSFGQLPEDCSNGPFPCECPKWDFCCIIESAERALDLLWEYFDYYCYDFSFFQHIIREWLKGYVDYYLQGGCDLSVYYALRNYMIQEIDSFYC